VGTIRDVTAHDSLTRQLGAHQPRGKEHGRHQHQSEGHGVLPVDRHEGDFSRRRRGRRQRQRRRQDQGVTTAVGLTRATVTVVAGRSATLKLAPAGAKSVAKAAFTKIKKATRKGLAVTATIRVRIVDAAGHSRRITRTVKLTR
jgi:hypothetical protein